MWALVDCNSFFASCEMVFRPDLKHKPVVVLSSNDGCIVAANKKAKTLGLKFGGPYFEVKNILKQHDAEVFSSNFPLYADMSRRVNMTLAEFTPDVEMYSIDECFLALDGIDTRDGLVALGQKMKQKVEKYTNISVGVGIGPTKVLAKAANYLAKNFDEFDGVCSLADSDVHQSLLEKIPVEEVWGIGYKSAPKLRALGIRNAWDFRNYQNHKLLTKLLSKTGAALQQELCGITCLKEELPYSKKKQIMCTRSFETPKRNLSELKEIMARFATDVAEKLRAQKSVCSTVMCFIRSSNFGESTRYYNQSFQRFDAPTSDTRKIIRAAFTILENIYQEGIDFKKAGIILCEIDDKTNHQASLFDMGDQHLDDDLMKLMDKINNKEGFETIKVAACGIKNASISKKNLKSPAYTSRWTEIPEVF